MPKRFALVLVGVLAVLHSQVIDAKNALVGHGVTQHSRCVNTEPRHCVEAAQLEFKSASTSLSIDFALRENPPQRPEWIDMVVTLDSPSAVDRSKPQLVLFLEGEPKVFPAREQPSAFVAPLLFADFLTLVHAPTMKGHVFGNDFSPSAKQLAILRLVADHWAAGESMFAQPK